MQKKLFIKNKWFLKIPTAFALKTKNTCVFFQRNQMRHTILNWHLLWFYITYQLKIFKQILLKNHNILLVTDNPQIINELTGLSKNLNLPFIAGNWQGGTLTKLEIKNTVPSCIINFNMCYSKNLNNEAAILSIPLLNLVNTNISWKNCGILYNIPIPSKINKNTLYFLITINIWIIKKYKKIKFYENFAITKAIDTDYINQLQTINYKLQIYKNYTKNYKYWHTYITINQNNLTKYWKNLNIFSNNITQKKYIKKQYLSNFFIKLFFPQQVFLIQQGKKQKNITLIKTPKINNQQIEKNFKKLLWKNF